MDPIKRRAIALFRDRGLTADNLHNIDAQKLKRTAAAVFGILLAEFGPTQLDALISDEENEIASMLCIGTGAKRRVWENRG